MSDFFRQAANIEHCENGISWLETFKSQQKEATEKLAFPHRKTEDWRYTSLRSVEQGQFFSCALYDRNLSKESLAETRINGLDSIDLVFVNGHFDQSLSFTSRLPSEVSLSLFSQATADERADIEQLLGKISARAARAKGQGHIFETLNGSQFQQGVYLKVSKAYHLETPIRVLNITCAQENGFTVAPRLLVNIERGASACVIEHFASESGKQNAFTNAVTELNIQDNAHLQHYRMHLEDESSIHIGGVHTDLANAATIESFYMTLGSKLNRVNVCVNHLGKGAHSEINGVYLPNNHQHVDFHTCIEHAVPHCTSNETFRGIIGDKAKAVFNGRIHIHKDAQKTSAQLSNKNLLTSNQAEVDTKPELEIYADDVQCAHGATVAQLNSQSLHYLKTRGISEEEARVMLSFGFINEILERINNQHIADYLRPKLATLFTRNSSASGEDLTRHIGS